MSEKPRKRYSWWKKNWLNALIIVLSVGILAAFLYSGDFQELIRVLQDAGSRWYYSVAAVAAMFVYFLLEAACAYILLKNFYPKVGFGVVFKTTMVGQFFNCTTPFATGGQPMQIFAMSKKGIGVGISTGVLVAKYVISQSVVALFGIVLVSFNYGYFSDAIPAFGLWLFIGLTICVGLVSLVFLLLAFPKFAKKTVEAVIDFLAKIHIVKQSEKQKQQAEKEIGAFYESVELFKNHKDSLAYMALLTAVQFLALFSITWFIYCAFGCPGNNDYLKIIGAQVFVHLIASYFPTPGATGASEFSYYSIFGRVFGSMEKVTSAMLIWRAITFYLPIAFGSFFAVRIQRKKAEEEAALESEETN